MLARLPLEKIAECLSELCAVQVMALKKVRPPMLNLGGGREKIPSPETPPWARSSPRTQAVAQSLGRVPKMGPWGLFGGKMRAGMDLVSPEDARGVEREREKSSPSFLG